MIATLLQDKTYSERGKYYTQKAGTKVTITRFDTDVCLVQNDKSQKFSIRTELLKITN